MKNATMNRAEAIKNLTNSIINDSVNHKANLLETVTETRENIVEWNREQENSISMQVNKLNRLFADEDVETRDFKDLVTTMEVKGVSLSIDDAGIPSLTPESRALTMSMLRNYLPKYTMEKVEAFGRVTALLSAYEKPNLYPCPADFVAVKTEIDKKTGEPIVTEKEKKVQEYIDSFKNNKGGFSISEMKKAFHEMLIEISQGSCSDFLSSDMYREFMDVSIARIGVGKRGAQSGNFYNGLFLELVHMIVTGKRFEIVK